MCMYVQAIPSPSRTPAAGKISPLPVRNVMFQFHESYLLGYNFTYAVLHGQIDWSQIFGGRPRGSSLSSSTATVRGRRGDGRGQFSGRRGPLLLLPTLAGLSGVAAVACVAATEYSRPELVLAAASTQSAPSVAVVGKENDTGQEREREEEGEKEKQENAALVAAAHELRRSLTPPHQSLFRVVCILVYEDSAGNVHRITGAYVCRNMYF